MWFKSISVLLCVGVFAVIFFTTASFTGNNVNPLRQALQSKIEIAGVENPVTAVLLNFRGYDTLVEMAVLLLALLGVNVLGRLDHTLKKSPPSVLETFIRIIFAPLILIALYLLWVGGHGAGGAFQAGSVLGAAGVLLVLAGWQMPLNLKYNSLRSGVCCGLWVFTFVAVWPLFNGRHFLEYDPVHAKTMIIFVECAATLSIGLTLTLLYIGVNPKEASDL